MADSKLHNVYQGRPTPAHYVAPQRGGGARHSIEHTQCCHTVDSTKIGIKSVQKNLSKLS